MVSDGLDRKRAEDILFNGADKLGGYLFRRKPDGPLVLSLIIGVREYEHHKIVHEKCYKEYCEHAQIQICLTCFSLGGLRGRLWGAGETGEPGQAGAV